MPSSPSPPAVLMLCLLRRSRRSPARISTQGALSGRSISYAADVDPAATVRRSTVVVKFTGAFRARTTISDPSVTDTTATPAPFTAGRSIVKRSLGLTAMPAGPELRRSAPPSSAGASCRASREGVSPESAGPGGSWFRDVSRSSPPARYPAPRTQRRRRRAQARPAAQRPRLGSHVAPAGRGDRRHSCERVHLPTGAEDALSSLRALHLLSTHTHVSTMARTAGPPSRPAHV